MSENESMDEYDTRSVVERYYTKRYLTGHYIIA